MRVVLIGFMGSGKSSVAEALAAKTGYDLVETDAEALARSECNSITEIFDAHGEESFRALEGDVLRSALKRGNLIVSSGGGILELVENRRALRELRTSTEGEETCVVYLDTHFETITRRLQGDNSRPLFRSLSDAEHLFAHRLPQYREAADLIIPTDTLSAEEVAELIMRVAMKTRVGVDRVGADGGIWMVIGDPVGHSRSPRLHGALLYEMGMPHRHFVAYRVRELASFFKEFRMNNSLQGLAVTVPHKESVMSFLDDISEEARAIGSVNTVVKVGEVLHGYNTAWLGIQAPLQQRNAIRGKRVAILGAGGTARAALFAVCSEASQVTLINRTVERAAALAAEFQVAATPLQEVATLTDFDTVIQTTSAELLAGGSPLFDSSAFRDGMVVLDAVYTPEWTPFLKAARAAGAVCITGREMFLAQAAAQFALHHGSEVSWEVMREKPEQEAFCEL
ncbi:MAG: shikimate dehydrogenase [Bdellovibrionota bacterium]